MAQTSINIRVDEDIKIQADALFSNLGMNMSTAVNIFLRQSLAKRGIPFEVKEDPFFSATNQAHLRDAIARLNTGKGENHDLIEAEDEDNMG
jgi:DNA-damage-inducible protein J